MLGTPLSPSNNDKPFNIPTNPLTIPWGRLSCTSSDVDIYGRIPNSNVQLLPKAPLSSVQTQSEQLYQHRPIKFIGLELNPSDRFNEYTIGRSPKCDVVASKPSSSKTKADDHHANSNNDIDNVQELLLQQQKIEKDQMKKQKFVHDLISNSHCRIFCLLKHDSSIQTMNETLSPPSSNNDIFTSPTPGMTTQATLNVSNINSNLLDMEVYIEDTSSNGTYINNTTLLKRNERRLLHTGDVICLLNPMIIRKKIRDQTESEEFLKHYSFVFVNLFTTCGSSAPDNNRLGKQLKFDSMTDFNRLDMKPATSTTPKSGVKKVVVGVGPNSNRKRGLVDVRAMHHTHDNISIFKKVSGLDDANKHLNENHLMPPPSSRKRQKSQEQKNTPRVEDEYDIRDEIGSGTCGQVRRAIHRQTGKMVAIKVITLGNTPGSMNRKLSNENDHNEMKMVDKIIQDEASILQSLNHPYIIKLIDVFIHPKKKAVYIVMELVHGGDLFDRIVEKGRYTETESRRVMRRLLAAIHYLHEDRDVVHRDLKPENILCVSRHDDVNVKLTDFGLAKSITDDGLKTFCGTPQYFAPEVLRRQNTVAGRGRYDKKADMWSLGVILYILLSGAPPFDASNSVDAVQEKYLRMQGRKWESISASAKELVVLLLKTDPKKRISVRDACEHKWILTKDGDTHVHPLKDPKVAGFHSKIEVTSRNEMLTEPTGLARGEINDEKVNQPSVPQSIVRSPSPKNKVEDILKEEMSPKMSESKRGRYGEGDDKYEIMTPSQAANFPLHEDDYHSTTNHKATERESLFSLVKQHSTKEDKKVDSSLSSQQNDNIDLAVHGKQNESKESTGNVSSTITDKQTTLSRWFEKE